MIPRNLPPLAYHPGVTPRPDESLFAPFKRLPIPATAEALAQTEAFRLGFTLFERGYFWEAHEVWEPVWMALPDGADKQLVQGLIQLANAGLKRAMGRDQAARRILTRADLHLAQAFYAPGIAPMGISKAQTDAMRVAIAL